MNPASLALTVLGLATLFSACIDAYERVDAYRNYEPDLQSLVTRFEANRTVFKQWGVRVGLGGSQQHERLKDPEVRRDVENIFMRIFYILSDKNVQKHTESKEALDRRANSDKSLPGLNPASSHRYGIKSWSVKGKWAVKGKLDLENQVECLEAFNLLLNQLVPDHAELSDSARSIQHDIGKLFGAFRDQSDTTGKILEALNELLMARKRQTLTDYREKALRWIQAVFSEDRYQAIIRDRAPETCEWILSHPKFQEWQAQDERTFGSKFLWISGPAGFGKTFVGARVVEHMKQTTPGQVACFFCSSDTEATRRPLNLLRSWLTQLVRQHNGLLEEAYSMSIGREQQTATEDELLRLLNVACNQYFKHPVLIADGFDELTTTDRDNRLDVESAREAFLESFLGLNTNSRILILSRPEVDIESTIKSSTALPWLEEIKVSKDYVQDDVRQFCKAAVQRQLRNKPAALQERLTQEVAKKCDGMFLLGRLQISRLSPGRSEKELKTIISKMPNGLERAFEKDIAFIEQLDDDDQARARNILCWIMFAAEPITIAALTEALITDANKSETHFPMDDLPEPLDEEYCRDRILGLCGSLIEIRQTSTERGFGTRTVHFVHFTAREFVHKLLHSGRLYADNSRPSSDSYQHARLGVTCLEYLCYEDFNKEQVTSNDPEQDLSHTKLMFFGYAAIYWRYHMEMAEDLDENLTSDLSRRVESLFDTRRLNWKTWAFAYEKNGQQDTKAADGQTYSIGSPLYYVSLFGIKQSMYILFAQGADPNSVGGVFGCPVHAAASKKNREAVQLLFDHGVSLYGPSPEYPGALGWAVTSGDKAFVDWLLHFEIDASFQSQNGSTALHIALREESRHEVAKLLIDSGASVTMADEAGMTPLMLAADNGFVQATSMIVEKGAEISTVSKAGTTALHCAASRGQNDVLTELLSHAAGIHCLGIFDHECNTPLHCAAASGHLRSVCILLTAGAELEAKTYGNATPLYRAAKAGHIECVEHLVTEGACIQPTDEKHPSILHAAVSSKSRRVAEYLLTSDDRSLNFAWHDDDADRACDETPLSLACRNGSDELVKLLLAWNASMQPNCKGHTPLRLATELDHFEIAEMLIDHGADIHVPSKVGYTAFERSCADCQEHMVALLLKHGAVLRMDPSGNGESPVLNVASKGNVPIFKMLLEAGGKQFINTSDNLGFTPMFIASDHGYEEIVKLCLESGADPNIGLEKGASALHEATREGHLEIAKLLLRNGAMVNAKLPKDGATPLYLAVQSNRVDLVELLLDHSADPTLALTNGWNPMLKATLNGHPDLIRKLAQAGFDVNHQTINGYTAIFFAIEHGHESALDTLLDLGANVEPELPDLPKISTEFPDWPIVVWNPLQKAIYHATGGSGVVEPRPSQAIPELPSQSVRIAILEKLLAHGARPNQRIYRYSQTALHTASLSSFPDVVASLIKHGADPTLLDDFGHSSLDWATSIPRVFAAMGTTWTTGYKPTAPSVRRSVLCKSLLQNFREYWLPQKSINFRVLAAFASFREDLDLAYIAHEYQTWEHEGEIRHNAYCDRCLESDPQSPLITGSRFVCRSCPDIDFCEACFLLSEDFWQPGTSRERCRLHEFIKVPRNRDSVRGTGGEQIDDSYEKALPWLETVLAKYERLENANEGDAVLDIRPKEDPK